MAKKKKAALKPAVNRGFATTSTPSKRPAESAKEVEKKDDGAKGDGSTANDEAVDVASERTMGDLMGSMDLLADGNRGVEETHEFDAAREEEQALQNIVDRLRDRVEKDVNRFWKTIEFDRRQAKQLPIFEIDPSLQEEMNTVLSSLADPSKGATESDIKAEEDVSDLLDHVQPSSAANELLHKALVTHALLLRLGFTSSQAMAALKGCESVNDIDECVAWLVARLTDEQLDDVERRCDGKTVKTRDAHGSDEKTDSIIETFEQDESVDETIPPNHPGFLFDRAVHSLTAASSSLPSGTHTPQGNGESTAETQTSADLSTEASQLIEECKQLSHVAMKKLDDQEQIDSLEQPSTAYAQARLFIIQIEKLTTLLDRQCKGVQTNALTDVRRKVQSVKTKCRSVIDECQMSPRWNKSAADAEFQRSKMQWEELERQKEAVRKPEPKADTEGTEPDAGGASAMDEILASAHDVGEAMGADFDDEDGLFGDMLDEQATEVTDQDTQTRVTLRELPPQALKSQGSKAPRNIVGEALRKKDPSAFVRFEPVSTGGRMYRSRLTIRWRKGQADTFTMTGMSTLSQSSADDLLALAALMCIDNKAAKSLGSGFAEWWHELATLKQYERDNVSRLLFKRILCALGARLERANREAEEMKRGSRTGQRPTASDAAHLPPNGSAAEDQIRQDERGKQLWISRQSSKAFKQMLPGRLNLPIAAYKQHIIDTIGNHQVTVLSGETGCGKSTQLPAYVLEHHLESGLHCKVLVTEPRRISAISLADRVSAELGEPRGYVGKDDSLIGSAVRLENNIGRNARLIYATTGIVLRMLEDGQLDDISHVIVDEVHERSIESDFLLIILKSLMAARKDLKVVLMSATLDAERFSTYFSGCPTINVPGRTFPVDVHWLEDAVELCDYTLEDGSPYARRKNHRNFDANNKARLAVAGGDDADLLEDDEDDEEEQATANVTNRYKAKTVSTLDRMDEYAVNHELIVSLLEHLCFGPEQMQQFSAATLIFLPGIADIRKLNDILLSHKKFGASGAFQVWPLHSTISSENQSMVFELPPEGVRKIVLSTNIAETGITIPDITCVIDSGKHREMRFDEKRQMSKLVECFVARSNAKQRRGRAGRVQNGICWHLFTRHRHDSLLAEHPIPEILRLSLQDLALKLKVMKIKIGSSIEDALAKALDAPSSINVQRAVASLIEIKALTTLEEITPLGRQLSRLPLDVYMAKFLLVACSFRILDSALTIAATLNAKSPFLTPFGRELEARAAKRSFDAGENDFVAMVRAFNAWRRATDNGHGRQFVQKCFLSATNLVQIEELRQQYLTYLLDAGFVRVQDQDERNAIVKARFRFNQHHAHNGGKGSRFVQVPRHLDTLSSSLAQVNAALATSLYPKLLVIDQRNGFLKTLTNNAPASIHPSSVNFKLRLDSLPRTTHHLLYFTIMQSRRLYAWETAAMDLRPILLLCGEADFKFSSTSLYVDRQRVRVTFYHRKTQLILSLLRQRITKLLQISYRSPGKPWSPDDERFFDLACSFLGVHLNDKDRVVV